ncbi:MAG: hypothetical protein LBJ48_06710 [Coriobacteriales bacterium]|jgi:hypothetical protein|nr:hypothetical protein [Coriobacteriales bacterium]
MNDEHFEETRSFRDPVAQRKEAAEKRREAAEAEYPPVAASYKGFYLRICDLTEQGRAYVLGAEGIIGSELVYNRESDFLLAGDGRRIAKLPEETTRQLAACAQDNWRITVLISAIFFRAEDKSVAVELAFLCWAPLETAYETALVNFSHNIAERLASGDRAGLALSQDQFGSVLRSGGEWYLTRATKREPLEKGTVVYKSRRSGTERLTGFALRHKTGCTVFATVFWIALAAGVVVLVWRLFF